MNHSNHLRNGCRNSGCTRPAEPGEDFCFACGLERSLYERDSRPHAGLSSEPRDEGETRR